MFNVVLVEPEIPQNTGNIARTCAATGSILHLVEPLGFSLDEKHLRRAGLDYWHLLKVKTYQGLEDFFKQNKGVFFYITTKAKKIYCDVAYPDNCYLIFGKETKGLPEPLLKQNEELCVRIPMVSKARSLNLSNSVAIVIYEALRQNNFINLKQTGDFFI